ncbi:MAG TPA: Crp/Fnr family transcriptional regulator [Sporichthya sp.]|nr:Crp/Fnr family transcriptional regulator [Sporichthya sp.]
MDPEEDLSELQRNAVLGHLPARELQRMVPHLDIEDAQLRDSAHERDKPITEVRFPLTSVYSVVGVAGGREEVAVEVATIGREGMVGLPLFLGASSSPHHVFCQVPGRSARLSAKHFRDALVGGGGLHRLLNRFVQAIIVHIAQNTVCNNAHVTERRAARWLLTTQDRAGADQFPLTQEFLAQMLGVRRPTVSEVAGALQERGLIRYSRGTMTIVDRPGLEHAACSCYDIVKREFDQMVAGPEEGAGA